MTRGLNLAAVDDCAVVLQPDAVRDAVNRACILDICQIGNVLWPLTIGKAQDTGRTGDEARIRDGCAGLLEENAGRVTRNMTVVENLALVGDVNAVIAPLDNARLPNGDNAFRRPEVDAVERSVDLTVNGSESVPQDVLIKCNAMEPSSVREGNRPGSGHNKMEALSAELLIDLCSIDIKNDSVAHSPKILAKDRNAMTLQKLVNI